MLIGICRIDPTTFSSVLFQLTKKALLHSYSLHRLLKMEFNRTRVARFQEQDCSLTLREAVDEYYTINSHLFSRPDPKTPWTHLLVHHDIGHVFFGVNTSILDEAAGDIWTLMGTDMTFREYAAYVNTPEGKKLVKEIGPWLIIKSLIYSPPLIFKIFIRSRRMKKKWESQGYEKHMNTPLGEVRRIYNLKILEC